jgi:hypothetical protein
MRLLSTDQKRLVERDRQRGEEVAQDVLDGESHGDAADTQARDERRDVDAEIVQREQHDQGPHDNAHDEPDDAERSHDGAIAGGATTPAPIEPSGCRR